MWRLVRRAVLLLLKLLVLTFVAIMGLIQVPELLYDFGSRTPVEIAGPEELFGGRFKASTFVAIRGEPDFTRAFSYPRYGLNQSYFNLTPYGPGLVVRTYERVTDEWKDLRRFMGRLQPFARQPFSYRIRPIYRDRMGVEIPEEAYYLALDDVPRPSGWQLWAVGFSAVLWLIMLYLFFLRRGGRRARAEPKGGASPPSK